MHRPAAGVLQGAVDDLDVRPFQRRSGVEALRLPPDRRQQGGAGGVAEFLRLGPGACDGVARRIDDGSDPALRRARVAKDRADRARGETDREDVAERSVSDDRHPQRDEALARDRPERPDPADHRPPRPYHRIEARAVGGGSELVVKGAEQVDDLDAVGTGELDGLPERVLPPQPLGLGIEGGEVRPVEARRGGLGSEDRDLRGDVGGDALGHPGRARHGGAAGQSTFLLRHERRHPAAEQQHGNGGRHRERDKGPAVAAMDLGAAGIAVLTSGGHAGATDQAGP